MVFLLNLLLACKSGFFSITSPRGIGFKTRRKPASRVTGELDMSSINRPRIIPSKRPLLPPRLSFQTPVNHSSKPADIQFKTPAFSSLSTLPFERDAVRDVQEDQRGRDQPVNVEFDFSRAPQPLLDPNIWDRMRKQEQESAQTQEIQSPGDAEDRERRRERDAEYGGLAIRGRTVRRRRG